MCSNLVVETIQRAYTKEYLKANLILYSSLDYVSPIEFKMNKFKLAS